MAALIRTSAKKFISCIQQSHNFCLSHKIVRRVTIPSHYLKSSYYETHAHSRFCTQKSFLSTAAVTHKANIKPSIYQGTASSIQEKASVIQGHANNYFRVDVTSIYSFMGEFRLPDSQITQQQSIWLMLWSGKLLVKNSPERRHQVYIQAWDLINDKLDGPMTTHLYNSSIRARLENEQIVNPADELQIMKEKYDITANRMTHQLLISAYCEQGDVEGAKTILEHMKANDMLVNEKVFNSVIKAHLINKDLEGAMSIFDIMKELNIVCSPRAYQEILNFHAGNNDFEAAQKLINKMTEDEGLQFNHHKHYFDMIVSASKNGHSDCVDQILTDIPQRRGYFTDMVNTAYRLIVESDVNSAFKVMSSSDVLQIPSTHTRHSQANHFIFAMIINKRPMSEVLDIMDRFTAANIPFIEDYQAMLNIATQECDLEYALNILKTAEEKGYSLTHAFPKFFNNDDNSDVLAQLLPYLHGDKKTSIVYQRFCWPALKRAESMEDIVKSLSDMGCPSYVIEACTFLGYLHQGQFSKASEMANSKLSDEIGSWLSKELLHGYKINQNWQEVTEVLQKIGSSIRVSGCNGVILRESLKGLTEEQQLEMVKHWQEKKIGILRYQQCTQSDKVEKVIKNLVSDFPDSASSTKLTMKSIVNKSVKDLKNMVEDVQYRSNSHMLKKRLFIKYVAREDYEEAQNLYDGLLKSGFVPDLEMTKFQCILEVRHKGNIDAAFNILQNIKSQSSEFSNNRVTYRDLPPIIAAKQIELGNLQDGLNTLNILETDSDYTIRRRDLNILLTAAAKQGGCQSVLEVLKVINELTDKDFKMYLAAGLIAVNENCPTSESISFINSCISSYNVLPSCQDLLNKLVESEDSENLQTVVDMIAGIYGEDQQINQLVVAFIETGKVRQARKLIQNTRVKAKMGWLSWYSQRLRSQHKVDVLLEMLTSMSDMQHIDLDIIIQRIIQTYCDQHKFDAAVDMLSSYEEYNITPRPRVLYELNDILLANNKPVPFKLPTQMDNQTPTQTLTTQTSEAESEEIRSKTVQEAKVSVENVEDLQLNSTEQDVLRCVQNGNFNEVVEKIKLLGADLSDTFLHSLLASYYKSMPRTFNALAKSIIAINRLDILTKISGSNLGAQQKQILSREVLLNDIERKGIDNILPTLEAKQLLDFTNSVLQHLTNIDSNAANKVRELMKSQLSTESSLSDREKTVVVNRLFCDAVIHDLHEAQRIIDAYPESTKKITSRGVRNVLFACQKADLLTDVLPLLKSNNIGVDLRFYTEVMHRECDKGNFSSAISLYKEAEGLGLDMSKCWLVPIRKIAEYCRNSQEALPWNEALFADKLSETSKE